MYYFQAKLRRILQTCRGGMEANALEMILRTSGVLNSQNECKFKQECKINIG